MPLTCAGSIRALARFNDGGDVIRGCGGAAHHTPARRVDRRPLMTAGSLRFAQGERRADALRGFTNTPQVTALAGGADDFGLIRLFTVEAAVSRAIFNRAVAQLMPTHYIDHFASHAVSPRSCFSGELFMLEITWRQALEICLRRGLAERRGKGVAGVT